MDMVVRIAICDDEYKDSESIRKIIDMYFAEQRITIRIDCFYDAEKLLKAQTIYNLVILDILLKDENGLDIAGSIHRKLQHAKIIFYSTEIKFAPKSYECYGDGFIVKPPIIKDVYECLDRVLRSSQDHTIIFKELV